MNTPQLKDDLIGDMTNLISARQVGRNAIVVDLNGNPYNKPLTELQQQRFDDFEWRLTNAWKRYDEAQG